jgi:hypothetical protein
MTKLLPLLLVVCSVGFAAAALADETSRSVHAIVAAGTAADGSSQIEKQVVEECIMDLPTMNELRPVTDSTARFMKAIGGELEDNRSIRTYSATIELTYVVYQKTLIVVTTSSIERSEPVFREADGRFDRSIVFESNPENGDMFAGRDLVKEYFFSTEQRAVEDARRRAQAWLEQKGAVRCQR